MTNHSSVLKEWLGNTLVKCNLPSELSWKKKKRRRVNGIKSWLNATRHFEHLRKRRAVNDTEKYWHPEIMVDDSESFNTRKPCQEIIWHRSVYNYSSHRFSYNVKMFLTLSKLYIKSNNLNAESAILVSARFTITITNRSRNTNFILRNETFISFAFLLTWNMKFRAGGKKGSGLKSPL